MQMKCASSAVLVALAAFAARGEVVLSDLAGGSTTPGTAELVATVQGTGDVFAEYAPAKNASRIQRWQSAAAFVAETEYHMPGTMCE